MPNTRLCDHPFPDKPCSGITNHAWSQAEFTYGQGIDGFAHWPVLVQGTDYIVEKIYNLSEYFGYLMPFSTISGPSCGQFQASFTHIGF